MEKSTAQKIVSECIKGVFLPSVIFDPGVLVKLIPPRVFLFSPTLVPPPEGNVNSGA